MIIYIIYLKCIKLYVDNRKNIDFYYLYLL